MSAGAAERFWAQVAKTDGCWEWSGTVTVKGYGEFCGDGEVFAHRFSWLIHFGPAGNLFVCHRCDNRKCVRPDHLFLGTAKENTQDAIRKGRFTGWRDIRKPKGEETRSAKLTAEQVLEIRRKRAAGQGVCSLAKEYGLWSGTVSQIVLRRSWKHLPAEEIAS